MSRQADVTAAPPAPRFAMGWAALVYALAALALSYPALMGRFLVSPSSDQYIAGFAFREFGAQMLRTTGEFPLWNPYLMGGVPFVAGMGGDIFYPTFLLRLVFETDVAMTWSFILHLFLAGLFAFGFLRAWGIGFFGALFGGAAYMLSGPVASLVSPGHDGKLYVAALLPLALWMGVRGIRDGRGWAWGVLALTVGLGVISPHPQLLQYMLLASGFFALYVAFAKTGEVTVPDRRIALGRLGLAAAAVLVGFLLGAIQYVPVFEYVEWSPRAGGRGFEYSSSFAKPPEEVLGTIIPNFAGVLDTYWGRNGLKLHGEYLGGVVLFFAAAAFGAGERRKSFVRFWLGAGIIALLWAIGSATPFFRIVYEIVPGTKFFRAPDNMFMVVAMAVAVLAAVGVERALSSGLPRRFFVGWGIAAGVLLLLAVPGVYAAFAGSFIPAPSRMDQVLAHQGPVFLGALRTFLLMGLAAAALVVSRRGRISRVVLGWSLVALAVVDLWTVERTFWRFMPPAEEIYASDPTLEYIKAQDQPGRVLAFGVPNAPMTYHDPMLSGSGLMVHDIRQVTGYHGNELGRYQVIGGKDEGWRYTTHPNFWQLYNVRWLLTNLSELPLPEARLVAGPARNAAGTMVYLYDLPGDQPAAWVAPSIVKFPDEIVRQTLLDPRYDDVRRVAMFDTSAAVQAQELTALPEPLALGARVTEYAPGRISIQLSDPAPAGAALIVSENFYPGWRATVDGRAAPAYRANYTLIGVPLEAGARSIELRFESEPYETGKTITLIALAVVALSIAGGVLLDRRRRRG